MKKPEVSGGNNKSVFGSGFILLAKRVFVVDKQNFFIYISSIHVNTDAMNGISLTKIFQRAVGWCKTVYGVKCLAREHQTLSGYVIFQASVDPASGERTWDGMSRNSIPIRVVPRKLMPSSLSLRRRLFYEPPKSMIWRATWQSHSYGFAFAVRFSKRIAGGSNATLSRIYDPAESDCEMTCLYLRYSAPERQRIILKKGQI